jgi:hypothetical protein
MKQKRSEFEQFFEYESEDQLVRMIIEKAYEIAEKSPRRELVESKLEKAIENESEEIKELAKMILATGKFAGSKAENLKFLFWKRD